MFSPYYALARRRGGGRAEPTEHVALNVCLYGRRARRWAMTERGRPVFARTRDSLRIGPSRVSWDGSALSFEIRELTVPVPSRLQGTVRVRPTALTGHELPLTALGRHYWRPIAPVAEVEVAFARPALTWRGSGYFDANHGVEPLERGIRHWHWSRAPFAGGTAVIYDVEARSGATTQLALAFDASGRMRELTPPPAAALPRSRWRIVRSTRSDDGAAQVVETLEDTPFYARSLVRQRLAGEALIAMHESLDLDRFAHPLVQAMLPFRMPRRRA